MMSFFDTVITPEAVQRASEVLRSGWVSEGPCVRDFEAVIERDLGMLNPVAVNSGTSALHLALTVAGVKPGDEVILPAQTFVATGHAILMQGAIPVFADIDPRTGNIDPKVIAQVITPRTKAIMPVHWGGYPCDLDEIHAICDRAGITIVEDAAHALGAEYRGTPIGAVSRFTCFSFQAIKHLTTGDGGALCCMHKSDKETAVRLRWFGIDRARAKPSELGEREFDISEVGYKYHMNDLAAAVGLGNLHGCSERLARRRAIAEAYRAAFATVPGLTLLEARPDRRGAAWLFTVLVERRDQFVRALAARDIPASVVHRRIDRLTVFGGPRATLNGQREFDEHQISVPLHSSLSDDDVGRVIDAVQAGW